MRTQLTDLDVWRCFRTQDKKELVECRKVCEWSQRCNKLWDKHPKQSGRQLEGHYRKVTKFEVY